MSKNPLLVAAGAALLLALGCNTAPPTQPPVSVSPLQMTEGEWRVTDQVFVVTDASGTMYMNETFPQAKALSRSFINSMPDRSARAQRPSKYAAAAVGFGGDDRHGTALGPFDRAALARKAETLEPLGAVDKRGGTTPLHDVFVEVQREVAPRGGPVAVVVFSDGLPDDPALATWAAYRIAAAHGDKVCFHTVQTGDDPQGSEFLQGLTGLSRCGSFRRAAEIQNPGALTNFARTVFAAELPPVAAAAPTSPCEGVVELRAIEFEFDSAVIRSPSFAELDRTVEHLKTCPDVSIRIEGHTDGIGSAAYNQGLSERRANSTRQYFVNKGIPSSRLRALGFGESKPLGSNSTDEGRARNRRVEVRPDN